MNKEKYYITVGYPLGKVFINEDYFLLDVKGKGYNLNGIEYSIWNLAWQYKTLQGILSNAYEVGIDDEYLILEIIEELKNMNLIIEIDINSIENLMKSVQDLVFDKQGLGVGHQPIEENEEQFLIICDGERRVNIIEYAIWCEGGSEKSIGEIINDIVIDFELDKNAMLKDILLSVIYLYENRLIILKG